MFIACRVCDAQNLVPNGDFEQGPDTSSQGWTNLVNNSTCSTAGSMPGPDFWVVETNTPDRMVAGSIPTCNWDNTNAYSGNAYCVFGCSSNYNEGGMAMLLSPLEQDSLYHLHYCVSMQTFDGLNQNPAQVAFFFNNGGNSIVSPIISTTQWQCYDTVFSALANSSSIIIKGNFLMGISPAANIDYVSLEKTSLTSTQNTFLIDNKIVLFPNPFNDNINLINSNERQAEIILYDIASRKILQQNFINSISINTEQLAKGIYIYEVRNKNGVMKKGKVVKD